nr:DUF2591 family protein [Morganella morganii]
MNKYRDKSDFEINKAVAVNINGADDVVEKFGRIYISDSDAMVSFDPCNNPADAMPIVLGNRIDIRLMGCSEVRKRYWVEYAATAFDETDGGEIITVFTSPNKNIYRAAMEVFLMMKEAENEK